MRIEIVKFEPSSKAGTFQLQVPEGSQVLMARMTRMGEGNLVVAAPDKPTGKTETVTLAALWEDQVRGQAGSDPHDWRHLGCWNFDSGDSQHLFVREPVQVLELSESVAPSIEALAKRLAKLEDEQIKRELDKSIGKSAQVLADHIDAQVLKELKGKQPKQARATQPAPAAEPERAPG